ncbi:hypothetical protein IC229_31560 [Spirosoma sp. BT702]|uniref:Uncharacterized protein n=1 Tax=Spirosoma profusum TaxID=2771354 RepID=A0A927GA25_9BACT|nr:hypothetical protein [Spirosoma profusum]MBD2705202.1 hypothetical protein [Spirosoma profusum]
MEDFTLEQINNITEGYRNLARALNEFQGQHWQELDDEQLLDINAYQNSLLNRAHDLQTRTVRPAFPNASDVADQIRLATDKARMGLQYVQDLPVALNIGAIVVAMASYVARPNVRSFQTTLRELDELLKSKAE